MGACAVKGRRRVQRSGKLPLTAGRENDGMGQILGCLRYELRLSGLEAADRAAPVMRMRMGQKSRLLEDPMKSDRSL